MKRRKHIYQRNIIHLLVLALPAILGSALHGDALKVDDFIEPYRIAVPKISGNGRFLCYHMEEKDTELLRVIDLKGGKHTDLPMPPKHDIDYFSWVGTDQHLLYRTEGKYISDSKWYLYDVDKREYLKPPRYLTHYDINDYWSQNPEGLILERLDDGIELIVYHQDLEGEKPPQKICSTPANTLTVICDPVTGIPKIAITSERFSYHTFMSEDKKGLESVYYKKDRESEWQHLPYFDSNYSEFKNVYESKIALALNPSGKVLYYGQKTEYDTMGIYAYDLETGTSLGQIANNPEYDLIPVSEYNLGSYGSNANNLIFSQKRNILAGVKDRSIHERILWRDPLFKSIQDTIDDQLPGRRINEIYDWDHDETVFLVRSYSDTVFDEYYLFDLKKMTLSRIGSCMPGIPEDACGREVAIRVPLRDGETMLAYFRYPTGPKQKKVPVVVEIPSTQIRCVLKNTRAMQAKAFSGYATLRIHPRGRTGFGKAFFEKGFEKGGEVILEDIEDAIRFFIQEEYIDPDRIAIQAELDAAFLALHAMSRNPEMFSAAVFHQSTTSMKDFLRKTSRLRKHIQRWDLFDFIRIMEKRSEFEGESFVSLKRATSGLKTPIMMVGNRYGKNEKELKRILKKRNVEFEIVHLRDLFKKKYDYEVTKAQIEFIKMELQFIEDCFSK